MKFKFTIFFLLLNLSCSHQPPQEPQALIPETTPESEEVAAIIDLSFYKEKSKNYKPVVYEAKLYEELEEENEQEIVSIISALQSEEERKFFDLGKKAPPPARYFILPVSGVLSSRYGLRKGRMHHGIDIPGKVGTPLKAANHGKVVFSGEKQGYGNVIILSHQPNIFTVYAHNSKNLVRYGQIVKKNETIALMGNTGRSTGAHVHFEIRKGTQSIDPLKFLAEQEKRNL